MVYQYTNQRLKRTSNCGQILVRDGVPFLGQDVKYKDHQAHEA